MIFYKHILTLVSAITVVSAAEVTRCVINQNSQDSPNTHALTINDIPTDDLTSICDNFRSEISSKAGAYGITIKGEIPCENTPGTSNILISPMLEKTPRFTQVFMLRAALYNVLSTLGSTLIFDEVHCSVPFPI